MSEIFDLVAPPVVLSLVLGVLFAALFSLFGTGRTYWEKLRANLPAAIGYSLPVTALGYTIGYLAASARSGDLTGLIPGVLTLVGGLSIYGFNLELRNRVIVGYCVFVFPMVLLYGIYVGSQARQLAQLNQLISLSETEKQIRIYRENRELPSDFPTWVFGVSK